MDQQHPIPQEISAYQFRLVGDMTLKQFFQVATGIVIALIIYSSGIIGIVKWPLVIISGLSGVALAFLPLQERPLDRWIVAFFRSVYSPTLFFWKKTETTPVLYQEATVAAPQVPAAIPTPPVAPIEVVPTVTVTEPVPEAPRPPLPEKKEVGVPEEKLLKVKEPHPSAEEPGLTIFPSLEEAEKSFLSKVSSLFSFAASMPLPSEKEGGRPKAPRPEEIKIKHPKPLKVHAKPEPHEEEEPKEEVVESVPLVAVSPTFGAPPPKLAETLAQFSKDAAPPFPPSLPNVIVGQVMDRDGKIIEGAILEIKDAQGHPVRALRSNKLGHFMTVTPLPNGNYEMSIEKNGFTFEPFSFLAKGELIPPIAIKSKESLIPEGGFNAATAS
jgi:hypothetical protein